MQDVIPLDTPFIVFVDPSSACNFRCLFCPNGYQELVQATGRHQGVMDLDLYHKIIDDIADFSSKLKVLRLYKDGEPFLNKHLHKMILYAKKSERVEYVDTTTNGSMLHPDRLGPVLEAGLDKINISVNGMSRDQYRRFTGFDFDFDRFVENVQWLHAHKGRCEVVIKLAGDLISEREKQVFLETFGDHCDRIFIENFAPCWPGFDVEAHAGIRIHRGIYQQPVQSVDTCPYIFYSISVNADGGCSACFLDWARTLVVGDVREQCLTDIWNAEPMHCLRMQNLEGRRTEHPVCSHCGQLTHGLPDNIDDYRPVLLPKFLEYPRALKLSTCDQRSTCQNQKTG